MRLRRKPKDDPVTPEVYSAVRHRDYYGCVAKAIPLAPLAITSCEGAIEIDHVFGRGLSNRGPSRPWNLVSLCHKHHRIKTERAKAWRADLLWYLRTFEPSATTDPEALKFLAGR